MSEEELPPRPRRHVDSRPGGRRVVPAWMIIPVAGMAGFITSRWPGLAFGVVVGIFLWRLRR